MSSLFNAVRNSANALLGGPAQSTPDPNHPSQLGVSSPEDARPKESLPHTVRHYPAPSTLKSLKELGVPLSLAPDCQACDDACSVPMNMQGYPASFSIDTTTPLLGHVKPFDYLILCSSGRSDWPHDVCANSNSVPGALRRVYPRPAPPAAKPTKLDKASPSTSARPGTTLAGLHPLPAHVAFAKEASEETPKALEVAILSSSHLSNSVTEEGHSLIVLPDWVKLVDVTPSNLPQFPIHPELKRPLPHRAIILICSHKTRDKRCSISAPILEEGLMNSLEGLQGSEWKIDRRGDQDLDPEEDWIGLFRVSHTGGHKFAGNVIINFPSGVSVWYGRVTLSDCARIVEETIVKRRVIPELLKGGIGLCGHGKGNMSW